jgi:hypothetical protein
VKALDQRDNALSAILLVPPQELVPPLLVPPQELVALLVPPQELVALLVPPQELVALLVPPRELVALLVPRYHRLHIQPNQPSDISPMQLTS